MEHRNDPLDEFIPGSNIDGGDDRPIFQDEQINDEDLPALTIDDFNNYGVEPDLDDYYVDGNGKLQLKEGSFPNIRNIL